MFMRGWSIAEVLVADAIFWPAGSKIGILESVICRVYGIIVNDKVEALNTC